MSDVVPLGLQIADLAGHDVVVLGFRHGDAQEVAFLRIRSTRGGSVRVDGASTTLIDDPGVPYLTELEERLRTLIPPKDTRYTSRRYPGRAILSDVASLYVQPSQAHLASLAWPALTSKLHLPHLRWAFAAVAVIALICSLVVDWFPVDWLIGATVVFGLAAYAAHQLSKVNRPHPRETDAPPPALAPGPTPAERVSVVKAEYGRLLGDIVYRIENSALFDGAVEETARFQAALIAWDGLHDDEAATEVEVAFLDARRQAEALGLTHLPETARDKASRAVAAVRTARTTDHPGEREAAGRSAALLVSSLALYYLPVVDPSVPSLIGERKAIEAG